MFQSWLFCSFAVLCQQAIASPISGRNATLVVEERGILFTSLIVLMEANNVQATPTTADTAAELSNMEFYVQYAAAAYCNSHTSLIGQRVTCSSSACPLVAAATVTNYAFLGQVSSKALGLKF